MSEAQDLIPMNIAKAMKLIVSTKKNDGRPALQQVLCETDNLGYETDTARFVGTNGHVLLIVDTKLPAPEDAYVVNAAPEPYGKLATSDLSQFIDSKGHRKPEFFRVKDGAPEFPDYRQVVPSSPDGTAVAKIGFDVSYMDMMLKIHKALKLGSSQVWSAKFDGECGPAIWKPEMTDADDEVIRSVTFVVMPCRLG